MAKRTMQTIKLVVIGDSGVGKTSLRTQYTSSLFSTAYRATIGTDFTTKSVPHPYDPSLPPISLQIWDTAGQERFSSLSTAFFRGADALMLVYDLNSPSSSSLESLSKWYKLFKEKAPILDEDEQDFCVVVVGNKLDLTAESDGGKKEKETLEFLSTFLPLPPPPPDTAQSIPIEATNGDALAVPSPTSPNFGTMTSTTGFSVYHTPSSSFRQSHAHTTSASTASNLFHTPRSSSFSPSRPESRILSPTSTISERTISPSRARNGTRDSSISRDRSSIASTIVPPPKPLPPPPPILYHASAKTAENVKEAFESVVLKCLLRREKEDREAALSEIANGEANGVVDLNAVKGKGTMKEKCCS